MVTGKLLIGCAGWSIPFSQREQLPGTESHLERYAKHLNAVEINSSFYRPHRKSTYTRWGESVADSFRFSVKVPQEITHEARLRSTAPLLEQFLSECACLGDKLGCLLLQLPPSLHYESGTVASFFELLRRMSDVPVACEPRHASWFAEAVDQQLASVRVARVVADPDPSGDERGRTPGGWNGMSYFRLHGTPKIYSSRYGMTYLTELAAQLRQQTQIRPVTWCIFDNTTLGAAMENALELTKLCGAQPT